MLLWSAASGKQIPAPEGYLGKTSGTTHACPLQSVYLLLSRGNFKSMLKNWRGCKCDLSAGENTTQWEPASSIYADYQTKSERQADGHIKTVRKDKTRDWSTLHFKGQNDWRPVHSHWSQTKIKLDCRSTFSLWWRLTTVAKLQGSGEFPTACYLSYQG